MFTDLIEYPIESKRLGWEAREVLKDLDHRPHLLVRLKLTGTRFPERALEPFARVGEMRSRFVEIAADGLSANAYFDEIPAEGVVEFGYGEDVLLRFPARFRDGAVERLDRRRLPRPIQVPGIFRRGER